MKTTLTVLLLGSHLLCVNLAAGGPLLAARLDWHAQRHRDPDALAAARWLARASLLALLLGAVLGLGLAWLKWSPHYQALWYGPLRHKLIWAAWEFLFSLLLLIGWTWWLPRCWEAAALPSVARGLIALLAASNLLYHFPLLLGVARRLVASGQMHGDPLERAVFRGLMVQHELPALAVHVTLASLAIAGGALLFRAWEHRHQGSGETVQALVGWGGRWALISSLAQFPVGLWLLVTLPPMAQAQVLGGDLGGTLLLVVSLGTAVGLIYALIHLLGAPPTPVRLLVALTVLLVTVLLMTALHQQAHPTAHTIPH